MPTSVPNERSLTGKLLAAAGSSWARILVFFGVSFILTPILLAELGVDLFGVFMLVSVSMALAGPLRGAIRKTLTRELTAAVSSRDPERVRRVFSNGVVLGAFGGAAVLVITAGLALIAPRVLRVEPEHQPLLSLAIALEGLLIVELLGLMAWHNLYFATHRIVEENAHRAINRSLDLAAILTASLVLHTHIFVAFVGLRFVLHTTHHLIKAWRAARLVPSARFSRAMINLAEIRSMAQTGGWSTANQIARLGFYQADQILLNVFFGPVYNGIYAIVNQLRSWARMFGGNVAFGIEAVAADLHEKGDREGTKRVLLSVMKITASITAFFAITAAVCAPAVVRLWLGKRLTGDTALLEIMTGEQALALIGSFVLIIAPSTIIAETHNSAANILYGMGLIRTYSIPMLIAAGGKIVLATVALALTRDPLWIAWATLIAQAALYIGAFGWIIVRHAGVGPSRLALEVYGRGMLAYAPVLAVGLVMMRDGAQTTVPTLLMTLAAMGAVFVVIFVSLTMTGHERRRLLGLVSSQLARRKRRSAPGGAAEG